MKKENKKIVFPGVFDPFTKGHYEIVIRASKLFENIIIAVAEESRGKEIFFPFSYRVEMIKKIFLGSKKKIEVIGFNGLLANFLNSQKCFTLLRGLRTNLDFEYEAQLFFANKNLKKNIETIFLISSGNNNISSTLIREILRLGGDISRFICPKIKEYVVLKANEIKNIKK